MTFATAVDLTPGDSNSGAARNAAAVTKDDQTELAYVTKGLYVGTTGDVAVLMADGTSATFTSVPAGAVLPIRVRRVKSVGTTASNIVAMW